LGCGARGWITTRSATVAGDVRRDADWTEVVVNYITLADTKEIQILARRLGHDGGDDPISGRAYYRLKSVREFRRANPGAVPDLTVNAAKRSDGTVTLMVVNTNFDADIATTIVVNGWQPGDDSRAVAWSLVGPTPWATNVGTKPEVQLVETPIHRAADGWQITLPRHSLTAVEIHP